LFFFLWKSQRYRQIYRQTKVNQFKVVLVLHLTLHYQHTEVDSSFRSLYLDYLKKINTFMFSSESTFFGVQYIPTATN
jgi:hypothetical protein